MFQSEQLPRVPTARLRSSIGGKKKGDLAAHEVDGNTVIVTFLAESFFGGIDRWRITVSEFEQKFELVGKRGR